MKRQSYSYCGLPPGEKLYGLSSKAVIGLGETCGVAKVLV